MREVETHPRDRLYVEIEAERLSQDRKWGEQNNNDFIWGSVLGEEVGEAHQAALQSAFANSSDYPSGSLRSELIQVAAVAVAWIECLDRRGQ